MNKTQLEVGIYLYGWYNHQKWNSHRCSNTPIVGFYKSDEAVLAKWQIQNLLKLEVDYVIFEMVSTCDASFEIIIDHTEKCIKELEGTGIGYTFFIDFWVFPQHRNKANVYREVIDELRARGWLNDIHNNCVHGKTLYLFSPTPRELKEARSYTPNGISLLSALWSPTWEEINRDDWSTSVNDLFGDYWKDAVEKKQSLREVLEPEGYFQFWEKTENLITMNETVPVIPGYDDTLLERDPQLAECVEHRNGQTLVEQFRRASEINARNIIIYSWNEYFEKTCIEPTLENGNFYLKLTSELIKQLKEGSEITMPRLSHSKHIKPVYLSDMHKRTVNQSNNNEVPTWDADDYSACVAPSAKFRIIRTAHKLQVKGVRVMNKGVKSWRIKSKGEEIGLGIRLENDKGVVLREGRSWIKRDIEPNQEVSVDIAITTDGLEEGVLSAIVDMVYEKKFWFNPGNEHNSTLFIPINHD